MIKPTTATHSSETREEIAEKLISVVGTAAVRPYAELETTWQQKITQAVTPSTQPACMVYPQTQAELAEVVACAHRHQWRLLLCGNGSKLSWGGITDNIQVIISTRQMAQLVEHAVGDLTVTVETGMGFAHLQTLLAESGQFLALDPTYADNATIGGIVATADAGSLRQRYGGVRDMLIGLSMVRADGQMVKAGGRVVKNVAGYDLMKLMTGAYGTLGILTQVTFRVYPLPEASQTLMLSGEPAAIAQMIKTLLLSALTPTAIDLLSTPTMLNLGLGQHPGLMVRFQSLQSSVREQSARLQEVGQTLGLLTTLYSGTDETALWQQLQEKMQSSITEQTITCKIGVRPSDAVTTLTAISKLIPEQHLGLIHAASGLGRLQFSSQTIQPHTLLEARKICQANSGFLSILQAPSSLKQQIDSWGYAGNALGIMQRIKQQFDPHQLLNPARFVGTI